MSRIGKMPVEVPAGVTVEIKEGNVVTVKGAKGTLTRELPVEMEIRQEDNKVIVSRPNDLKRMKSLHSQWCRLPCCKTGKETGTEPGLLSSGRDGRSGRN